MVNKLAVAYRVLAWVVGLNLILVMTGFIGQKTTDELSWFNQHDGLISGIDVAHGWLFMVLIVLIIALARRHRWTPAFTITTVVLATIPLVSFWAEHRATAAIKADTPVA
ncbi:MAG: DUF3817 domain-containing protein [Actinomycetales bacterium]|nr:MAG: DUF3817 domain-containing protein [Actinomycetales bacterium]